MGGCSNVGLVDAWESAWFLSLESAVLVDKGGELARREWVGWYDIRPTWIPLSEPCSFVAA